MKNMLFGLIILVLTISSCKSEKEEIVENKEYFKMTDIRVRDPFILADKSTQTYYLYVSMANQLGYKEKQNGVITYKSKDLENWEGPKTVFKVPDDFWAKEMVWAPEVHEYKGKYYLFTTFTSDKNLPRVEGRPELACRGTQILWANSPEGPFKPFRNEPHITKDWMTLDGTFYVENNIPYLIFCHEWVQIVDGTIELAQLSSDLSQIVGSPKTLFHASSANWVRNLKDLNVKYGGISWNGYVTDGPFLYKTKTNKLLIIWSSFGDKRYAIGVAISKSGSVNGPWYQSKEPLFKADGGHGMIFKTFQNKLMLVLHQPNQNHKERAVFYELLDNGDGISLKLK